MYMYVYAVCIHQINGRHKEKAHTHTKKLNLTCQEDNHAILTYAHAQGHTYSGRLESKSTTQLLFIGW